MSTMQASRSRADSPQMMDAAPSSKPTPAAAAAAGPGPSPSERDSHPSPCAPASSSPARPPPTASLADDATTLGSRSRASTPPTTNATSAAAIADSARAAAPTAGNGNNGRPDNSNKGEEARDPSSREGGTGGGGEEDEDREATDRGIDGMREPSEGATMEETATTAIDAAADAAQFEGMALPDTLGRAPSLKRMATDATIMTEILIERAEHTIGMDMLDEIGTLSEEPTVSMQSTASDRSKASAKSSRSTRSNAGSKKSTTGSRRSNGKGSVRSARSKKSVRSAASDHGSVATDVFMDTCANLLAEAGDVARNPKAVALPPPIAEEEGSSPPSPVDKAEEEVDAAVVDVGEAREPPPPVVREEDPSAVPVEPEAAVPPVESTTEAETEIDDEKPSEDEVKAKLASFQETLNLARATTPPPAEAKDPAAEPSDEPADDKAATEEAGALASEEEKAAFEGEKTEDNSPNEMTSVADGAIERVATDGVRTTPAKGIASRSKRRIKSLSMKKLQMSISVESVKMTAEERRAAATGGGGGGKKDPESNKGATEKRAVKMGLTSPSNLSAKAKLRASKLRNDISVSAKSVTESTKSDKSNRSKSSSRKSLLSKRMSSIRKKQGSKVGSEMADKVLNGTAENKHDNADDSDAVASPPAMVVDETIAEGEKPAAAETDRDAAETNECSAEVNETIAEGEKPAAAETNEDEVAVAAEQSPVDTSRLTKDMTSNTEDAVTEPKVEGEDMAGQLPSGVQEEKENAIASPSRPTSPAQSIGESVASAMDDSSKTAEEARGGMVGFISSLFTDPALKPASESDIDAKEDTNLQPVIKDPAMGEAESETPDEAEEPKKGLVDDRDAKATAESGEMVMEEEGIESTINESIKTKQEPEEVIAAQEDESKSNEEEKPIADQAQSGSDASIAEPISDMSSLPVANASEVPIEELIRDPAAESATKPAEDKAATEEAGNLVVEVKAASEEDKKEDEAPLSNSPDAINDACRDLNQTETTSVAGEAITQVATDKVSNASKSSASKSKRRIKSLSMKKLQMGVIMESVKGTTEKKRAASSKTIKDTEKQAVKKGSALSSNLMAKVKRKSNKGAEMQAVKEGSKSPSNFMAKAKLRASKQNNDSSVSVESLTVSPKGDKLNQSKFSFSSISSRKSLLSKRASSTSKKQGSKGIPEKKYDVLYGSAENEQDNTNDADVVASGEVEKPAAAETNEDEAAVAVEQSPVDTSVVTSEIKLNPEDAMTKTKAEDEDMADKLPGEVQEEKEKAITSPPRSTSPTQSISESVASAMDEASKAVEEARGGMVGFISSLFNDPAVTPAKEDENLQPVIEDPVMDEAKRETPSEAVEPKNGSVDDPDANATAESEKQVKEEEGIQSAIEEPANEEVQPETPNDAEQTAQEREEVIPKGESNQAIYPPLPSPKQDESIELFAEFASSGPSLLTSAKPQEADESTSNTQDKPLGSYPMINFVSSPENEGSASTEKKEFEATKKVEARPFNEDEFLEHVSEEAPNIAEKETMAKMLTEPAVLEIPQKHAGRIRARALSPMKKFRMNMTRASTKDTDNSTITTAPSQKVNKKKKGKIGVLGKKVVNPLRKSSDTNTARSIPFSLGASAGDSSSGPDKALPNEEHIAADAFSAASATNPAGKTMAKSTTMEKDPLSVVASKKQAGKAKLETAMKVLKEKQAAASSKREVARERANKKTVLQKELDEELRYLKVEKRKLQASYSDKHSHKENSKKQQAMEKTIQDREFEAAKKKAEIAQVKLDQAKAEQEATHVESEALEARVEAKRVLDELKIVKLRAEKEQQDQQITMQKMLQEQHLQQLQIQTNAAEQMKALQSQTQKWQIEQMHAAQINTDIEQKQMIKQLEFEHQTERMNSEIVQQRLLRAESEASAERAKVAKTKAELEAAANSKAAKEAAKNARSSPFIQDAFRCMKELSFKDKDDQTLVSELTGHVQMEDNKAYKDNTPSYQPTDKCGVEFNSRGVNIDCGGLSSFEDTVQGFLQWFECSDESETDAKEKVSKSN